VQSPDLGFPSLDVRASSFISISPEKDNLSGADGFYESVRSQRRVSLEYNICHVKLVWLERFFYRRSGFDYSSAAIALERRIQTDLYKTT
jgi:hypothetical protein